MVVVKLPEKSHFKKYSDFMIFFVITFTIIGNIILFILFRLFPDHQQLLVELVLAGILTTDMCAVITVILVQRNSEKYFDSHKGIDDAVDSLGRFLMENKDLYQAMTTGLKNHQNIIIMLNKKLFSRLENVKDEDDLKNLLEVAKKELFMELKNELNKKPVNEI